MSNGESGGSLRGSPSVPPAAAPDTLLPPLLPHSSLSPSRAQSAAAAGHSWDIRYIVSIPFAPRDPGFGVIPSPSLRIPEGRGWGRSVLLVKRRLGGVLEVLPPSPVCP